MSSGLLSGVLPSQRFMRRRFLDEMLMSRKVSKPMFKRSESLSPSWPQGSCEITGQSFLGQDVKTDDGCCLTASWDWSQWKTISFLHIDRQDDHYHHGVLVFAPFNFPAQEQTEELKKRVTVLESQLRKSEAARKGFEMSTGKLLSFVEVNDEKTDVLSVLLTKLLSINL